MKLYRIELLIIFISICGCVPLNNNRVFQSKTNVNSGPIFTFDEESDKSIIQFENKEIIGIIKFRNTGNQTLNILRVSGNCSCFAGYSGDQSIKPGQRGEIKVHFTKTESLSTASTRTVKIETNDINRKLVNLFFNFNFQEQSSNDDVSLLPKIIDYGRDNQNNFYQIKSISITVPILSDNDNIIIEAISSNESLKINKVIETTKEVNGSMIYNVMYNLYWDPLPTLGSFIERITFSIEQTGKLLKTIELPIRGEVI
jgi:hypothetical protein